MEDPKFLFTSVYVSARSYGIGQAVLGPVTGLTQLGCRVSVWSSDKPKEIAEAADLIGLPTTVFRTFPIVGHRDLSLSPAARSARVQAAKGNEYDLLISASPWSLCDLYALKWKQISKRPLVSVPHGALMPRALSISRLKKQTAMVLYERRLLEATDCFIVLSPSEEEALRALKITGPAALIANGVSDQWLSSTGDREPFMSSFGLVRIGGSSCFCRGCIP